MVVTLTADELGTSYTGISGIEKEIVNLHDVGVLPHRFLGIRFYNLTPVNPTRQ